MNIREAGTEAVTTTTTTEPSWGVGEAFGDAARNAVKALNAIVRALGIIIPVLVVLAILAFIVYRAWHRKSRIGQTVGGSQPDGTSSKPEAKS
jgi:ribose/xylose/arabinose/galactoside ABC-type transport system permease subunit